MEMGKDRFLLESIQLNTTRLLSLLEEQNTVIRRETTVPDPLPEWVNLELAVEKKGGGSLSTYRTRLYLQPCCGRNSKRIAGRKCWHRDDVLEWLQVTDDKLPEYAQKWGVSLPPDKQRQRA